MASAVQMVSAPPGASLASMGFETLKLFQRVKGEGADDDRAKTAETTEVWLPATSSLATEAERFELWAVNLGLFVAGHGSLDYRVREADRLAQTIRRFMQELNNSLAEIIELRNPQIGSDAPFNNEDEDSEGEQSDPDSLTDDDGDETEEESEIGLLLDGVKDPIDRLYKVSTRIRNPSSRLGSSRATNFRKIDEESGVDFLHVIEAVDYDHVRSLFLEYQKSRALQEHEVAEPPVHDDGSHTTKEGAGDCVWEPIRTVLSQHRGTESFLVPRIARANVRRRQQFAYWSNHHEKLARHARASISTQSVLTPAGELPSRPSTNRFASNDSGTPLNEPSPFFAAPSVTTATNLLPAKFEAVENHSVITVSEYAPSTWQPARDVVDFPPPPKIPAGESFFECPYCFTICPRAILSEKSWKAHLIHDLRPYVCTYEDCKNPNQLYDTRHDWNHHENTCHRKVWRCPEHSDLAFTQLDSYQSHLRSEHRGYSDDLTAGRIIRASESILATTDRPCPVCSIVLDTPRALQSHLALHLERFSLFSLPRSVVCDGDAADDGSASDMAHGTIQGSRDEDFEGEFDIKSEGYDEGAAARDEVGAIPEHGGQPQGRGASMAGAEAATGSDIHSVTIEQTAAGTAESTDEHEAASKEAEPAARGSITSVVGTTRFVFEDHNTPVYTVCFSPGDELLASVSDDKVVRIWDLKSGASKGPLQGHKSGFRSLAWSHDGRTIASGSYDRTVKLWDATTGACLHTLSGHAAAISGLAFSPDDRSIVSASHDKTCKLWDVEEGKERLHLSGHTAGLYSVGISPDGRWIVSGANDRTLKVWNLSTGALRQTLRGHGRVVYALAFSPDGGVLASGSNDWKVKLWDLDSGRLLRTLEGHEKGVTALAFSPDGGLMASGAYDSTVRLWDTGSWRTVGTLLGHSADVYGVCFARGGGMIASGSRDRTVRLWDLTIT